MKKLLVVLLAATLAVVVSSCAIQQKPKLVLTHPYDASEVQKLSNLRGKNKLIVNGFLRTNNGEVKTCAAMTVYLKPLTARNEEIAQKVFGNIEGGIILYDSVTGDNTSPYSGIEGEEELLKLPNYNRTETCNSDARATFNNVADGTYYVAADIVWQVHRVDWLGTQRVAAEGGSIMRRVAVRGGETKEVILTNN